jgi:hypothetical protein
MILEVVINIIVEKSNIKYYKGYLKKVTFFIYIW